MRITAEQQAKSERNLQNANMDARRFIMESFDLISDYPLETYGSALVWLPECSHIRTKYGDKRKTICKVIIGLRKVWDACEKVFWGHMASVRIAVFSPDGSRVVSGSKDKTVRIWNAATGECDAELKGHSDEVYSVVFSPDGSRAVSGSKDNTVRLWNAATGECEAELKGHSGDVYSVVFSPDCSRVVSGSFDNTVRIWNAATGESEAELKGHSGEVYSVVFSPDGSRVVSGSEDNTVRIWNAATGESEAELKGHSGRVYSVIFSPDGSRVVSGSEDDTVRIWNAATGESEAELKGHSGRVKSVVFSPDGSHVASGSDDATVRIWNIATGVSTVLADRALLQDGIYVYHRPGNFHISPPLPSTGTPSIHLDTPWIVHTESGLRCWLPPQYRNVRSTASHATSFCIGLESGILLVVKFCCSDPPNAGLT